ncbi:Os01g0803500 [Oryza sativa Japonica Group]|jgi:hypothetical protein|uniref:Os01g0803500 protein n=5 Tax=Oryza TaxID=4527 RepID=A0A0P0V9F8_ORYSJ|nr:hypothetical protein OsI_04114 [Oryza sativa Indica Group]BAS74818.1 Os01g0803500 [Oryza sativa Japonica Group]
MLVVPLDTVMALHPHPWVPAGNQAALALAGGHSSSRSGQTKPTGHQRQFAAVHARSGDDALIGGPRVNDPTRQGLIRRDANEWGMDRREEEAGD